MCYTDYSLYYGVNGMTVKETKLILTGSHPWENQLNWEQQGQDILYIGGVRNGQIARQFQKFLDDNDICYDTVCQQHKNGRITEGVVCRKVSVAKLQGLIGSDITRSKELWEMPKNWVKTGSCFKYTQLVPENTETEKKILSFIKNNPCLNMVVRNYKGMKYYHLTCEERAYDKLHTQKINSRYGWEKASNWQTDNGYVRYAIDSQTKSPELRAFLNEHEIIYREAEWLNNSGSIVQGIVLSRPEQLNAVFGSNIPTRRPWEYPQNWYCNEEGFFVYGKIKEMDSYMQEDFENFLTGKPIMKKCSDIQGEDKTIYVYCCPTDFARVINGGNHKPFPKHQLDKPYNNRGARE